MRASRVLVVLGFLVVLGACRTGDPIVDPNQPESLAPCPAGEPHLLMAVNLSQYDAVPALLRFDARGVACQGVSLPTTDYGSLYGVGGLPDGTDLVGVGAGGFGGGGAVVRFDGTTEIGRVEDPSYVPFSFAPVTFSGQPAVAVLWGSSSGSSPSSERVDLLSQASLAVLATYDVSWGVAALAAAVDGQAERVSGFMAGDGLQTLRMDPGAESFATTGELQAAVATNAGSYNSLDVFGDRARAASDDGVHFWQRGVSPSFLGPTWCQWPDVAGTPLPEAAAHYESAVIDRADPDGTALVLVDGQLEGGSEARTHLYRVRRRGECELLYSIPDTHRGTAIAWSGTR